MLNNFITCSLIIATAVICGALLERTNQRFHYEIHGEEGGITVKVDRNNGERCLMNEGIVRAADWHDRVFMNPVPLNRCDGAKPNPKYNPLFERKESLKLQKQEDNPYLKPFGINDKEVNDGAKAFNFEEKPANITGMFDDLIPKNAKKLPSPASIDYVEMAKEFGGKLQEPITTNSQTPK